MNETRWAALLPPLWARWAVGTVLAVAVIATVVIAIHRAGPEVNTSEAGAEAEVNRISDVAISEDQAPHSASLPAGAAPARALELAIGDDVRQRIAGGQLTGPLQHIACRAAVGARAVGRDPYSCTVRSAGLTYPFVAILDTGRRRLTWCKVDPPPVANVGPEVPLSASCKT
jgi:hypothetical protein